MQLFFFLQAQLFWQFKLHLVFQTGNSNFQKGPPYSIPALHILTAFIIIIYFNYHYLFLVIWTLIMFRS